MSLEIQLSPKLTHKLKLSPQIKLSLTILQLPLAALKEYVTAQIEENPLLKNTELDRLPNRQENSGEKSIDQQNLITKPATLSDHLLKQLRIFADSRQEYEIGELIIEKINEDGYIKDSLETIIQSKKIKESQLNKILSLIQTFDPPGVGARNLRECLLIQLKAKGEKTSLAFQIADKYLPYLEKKRLNYIAEKLHTDTGAVKAAVKRIAALEPKPGRAFDPEKPVYLMPDIIIKKNRDSYEVEFNDSQLPRVTINEKYKKMLKEKNTPPDVKNYLKERFRAALTLITAINKRKQTIQQISKEIVNTQKKFLDKGVSNLAPLTLSKIAEKIGKHKSTVSRAMSNKYVQTPHGILELKYFLSSEIKQKNKTSLSSKAIKSMIKSIIDKEKGQTPYSDQKITDYLNQKGIVIRRRTVTKYRQQLKILPAISRQAF